jgi:hypothetical protein
LAFQVLSSRQGPQNSKINVQEQKKDRTYMKKIFSVGTLLFSVAAGTATAGPIDYVNWNSDAVAGGVGAVNGTLLGGTVNVTYTGEVYFDQLNNTGTYYYTGPSQAPGTGTEYTANGVVGNTPSTSDIIAIQDIAGVVDTFTFSKPVVDPVMLLVSLGQPSVNTTYTFDTPVKILSDGPGWWGGPGTLLQPTPNSVEGIEGDGAIEFLGSYTSISFTTANPEAWNGFTLGVPTSTGVPDGFSSALLLSGAMMGLGFIRRKLS